MPIIPLLASRKKGEDDDDKEENPLDIHTYDADIFNMIASTDIFGSRR